MKMLKHISNAIAISKIENEINEIDNVEACMLIGFNTANPSLITFFKSELNLKEKENVLKQVNKIMQGNGLLDILEIRHGKVSFNIIYYSQQRH